MWCSADSSAEGHPQRGRGGGWKRTRRLTDYDVGLLVLLCTEMSMAAAARALPVSGRTLRHSRGLLDKIAAAGRIEAVVRATRHGLL